MAVMLRARALEKSLAASQERLTRQEEVIDRIEASLAALERLVVAHRPRPRPALRLVREGSDG